MDNTEIERRRQISISAMKTIEKREWSEKYQAICDKFYWENGPCCAGCDHWESDAGMIGICTSAPIVSGEQVLKSIGITSCTYTPRPGHPYTEASFKCGSFKDEFEWSTLPAEYLNEIGASKQQRK